MGTSAAGGRESLGLTALNLRKTECEKGGGECGRGTIAVWCLDEASWPVAPLFLSQQARLCCLEFLYVCFSYMHMSRWKIISTGNKKTITIIKNIPI